MAAIEKIDKYFIAKIIEYLSKEDMVIVTCDHATPCELGIHSADCVPLLLYGNKIIADKQRKFSETNAGLGSCKIRKATEIFPYIKKLGDMGEKE